MHTSLETLRPRGLERVFLQHPLARYGGAALIIATSTLLAVGLEPVLQTESIQLFYVLGVLLAAITSGFIPATLAALLSFISINFFFTDPRYTLFIARPEDIPRLVEFVIVAILAGALASYARHQAGQAQRRGAQAVALYALSQAMSAATNQQERLQQFVNTTARLLDLPFCSVQLNAEGQQAHAERKPRDGTIQRLDLPLEYANTTIGALTVGWPLDRRFLASDDLYLLRLLAAQLGQALENARLAEAAAQIEHMRESDKLKTALLSSISHDLRTPLAAIKGAASELQATDVHWSPELQQQLLATITDQTARLNHLVANLLDLSRIQAGAVKPNKDWYSIDEVIYHTLDSLAPLIDDHTIDVEIAPDLPLIQLDFVLTEQVLSNLLINALRYSSADQPISVSASATPQELIVAVRDHGPGIAASDREHVFEPFYRARQSADRVPGSGVGLAICRGFIEVQGGRIWLDASYTAGALIGFALPRPEEQQL